MTVLFWNPVSSCVIPLAFPFCVSLHFWLALVALIRFTCSPLPCVYIVCVSLYPSPVCLIIIKENQRLHVMATQAVTLCFVLSFCLLLCAFWNVFCSFFQIRVLLFFWPFVKQMIFNLKLLSLTHAFGFSPCPFQTVYSFCRTFLFFVFLLQHQKG